MNVEELRSLCLQIPGVSECLPFDDVTLVYKIMGKMFALIPLDADACCIALKCDPEQAISLRERYKAVVPARHFNKTYWNTINLNEDFPDKELQYWIQHSVGEVLKRLPAIRRREYQQLSES